MEGKRTAYTLTQKIIFIQEFEKSGATKSSISKKFNVPPGTLRGILNKKDQLLREYSEGVTVGDRKRKSLD